MEDNAEQFGCGSSTTARVSYFLKHFSERGVRDHVFVAFSVSAVVRRKYYVQNIFTDTKDLLLLSFHTQFVARIQHLTVNALDCGGCVLLWCCLRL